VSANGIGPDPAPPGDAASVPSAAPAATSVAAPPAADQPPRVWWISPMRNEAEHLEQVAAALAAQTLAPARWTVVDDGSDDGTGELLHVLATPPGHTRAARDRLAAGGPDRAWRYGFEHDAPPQWTHVGKLDGDIVLPPAYQERLLARFAADRTLGMASGTLTELHDGAWRRLPTPADQVAAPCRLFTAECYAAIGGWPPRLGADVITTTRARMQGFTTCTFDEPELRVRHLRPIATANGTLRGRARHGAYQYVVRYPWWWVAARSALVAARFHPRGLSGAAYFGGYVRAALGPREPVQDPMFAHFMRIETGARAKRAVKGAARRLW
jgi:biofilm PGA synthesis N-glycosyltransferase PgaC